MASSSAGSIRTSRAGSPRSRPGQSCASATARAITTAADGTITLLAKSDKYLYSEVSFQSDPDFAIRKLVVKLQDNSVIEYRFDGEKRNPTLSDELFKFTPPAGVQIVQANR